MYLGIDVGGTHTDAVLYHDGHIYAFAKVKTQRHTLPLSIKNVLHTLQATSAPSYWQNIKRVTLGTTLGLNALVQNTIQPVGLFVTAGPGMDALRFTYNMEGIEGMGGMGDFIHKVEGGLDHRGQEVSPLCVESVIPTAQAWYKAGVRHFAVAGKFSVHNPAHEKAIAQALCTVAGIEPQNITLSHTLSGALNFPRRMAAAFINAAIQDVQRHFLQAVQQTLQECSLQVPIFLLKADGGSLPWDFAFTHPLYTVLSGPAASVMGGMVLQRQEQELAAFAQGDTFLLDMGGTTTDIALYVQGVPVLHNEGMALPIHHVLRKTPLRSLATLSLGIGGDSLLKVQEENKQLCIGPQRLGDAAALGGTHATLLDALNVCAVHMRLEQVLAGDVDASQQALQQLAHHSHEDALSLAQKAVEKACTMVFEGMQALLQRLTQQPVYTLAELLENHTMHPQHVVLVGAPAKLFAAFFGPYVQKQADMHVAVPKQHAVANALGAAATLPTAHVEFFADTLQKVWHIPTLNVQGELNKNFTLKDGIALATQALREHFPSHTQEQKAKNLAYEEQAVDVVTAQSFAILDAHGRGGKDIRIVCQWRPCIV